ncbi:MAG TPA: DUF1996 domain-containing protein [Albitalea sp.]|uniref:DUF1996 domain-containing protein n=1 Tax=Piscinibacter sp. TaxID=1903157 RepID=UPI002ED56016
MYFPGIPPPTDTSESPVMSASLRPIPLRFALCLFAAAAVAACGGGGDVSGPASASEAESLAGVQALTGQDDLSTESLDGIASNERTASARSVTAASTLEEPVPQVPGGTSPVIVDMASVPARAVGQSELRVKTTTQVPNATSIGAFRTLCDFSHMATDDPIVFPGQPGRSHLHTFFGNTDTNADTTAESLVNTGNSTCIGGIANRTAYWVPSMIDTATNAPVKPKSAIIYYKTGYNGIRPQDVRPLPAGLRMIAGNAKNTTAKGPFRFECIGKGSENMVGMSIQNCPVGAEMWQVVFFPQCWDGVNLDSPDHKSHMSYTVNHACPATHPVPLPEITFNITYVVTQADAPLRWRLASDAYDRSLPAGYSSHGDWFNGWKQDIMESWVRNCDQASKDCHASLLGEGRAVY